MLYLYLIVVLILAKFLIIGNHLLKGFDRRIGSTVPGRVAVLLFTNSSVEIEIQLIVMFERQKTISDYETTPKKPCNVIWHH